MFGNELIYEPLPPETLSPMPPRLHYVYERDLGWPGRPEDERPDVRGRILIDPAMAFRRRERSVSPGK